MEKNKKKKKKQKYKFGIKEFLFNFFSLVLMIGVGTYFGYRSLYYYSRQNQTIQEEAQTLNGMILQNVPISKEEDGLHRDSLGYYFKGNVNNNYVLFTNQLFRIIRIYEDNTVQLIREDYVSIFPWGDTSNYENSNVHHWLDKTEWELSGIYYETLHNVQKFFTPTTYQIDVLSDDKIISSEEKQSGYISILTVTDYVLAQGKNSYLNNGETFFLLGENEEGKNLYVDTDGSIQSCDSVEGYGIRPVLTLKENTVIIGGDGTKDNPYVISQGEDTNYISSYVKLGNDLWKVFYQNNNILKLSYEGYASINGVECLRSYSQTNSIYDIMSRENIGYYLNSTYLSSLPYQDILLPFDSYIGEISDDKGYQYSNVFNNTVSSKVSLLNIFDPMFNIQLEDYFRVNTTSEVGSMAYNTSSTGFLLESDVREEKHIVPVISIDIGVLKNGSGTMDNPYVVE